MYQSFDVLRCLHGILTNGWNLWQHVSMRMPCVGSLSRVLIGHCALGNWFQWAVLQSTVPNQHPWHWPYLVKMTSCHYFLYPSLSIWTWWLEASGSPHAAVPMAALLIVLMQHCCYDLLLCRIVCADQDCQMGTTSAQSCMVSIKLYGAEPCQHAIKKHPLFSHTCASTLLYQLLDLFMIQALHAFLHCKNICRFYLGM